jgi:N-acetylglucosamine kinase-like BadF-type ATPase
MTLLLGVDGGNSKSIALVATANGSIVAAARRLGSADIYSTGGAEAAIERVRSVVAEALAQAGVTSKRIGAAAFSMAGADWPEDFDLLGAALQGDFPTQPLIVNDAIGALAGAVPEGAAVVVSLGTGAATGARGADGSTWHSSFWQAPQGAGELAHRSLTAVVRAEMGIGAPTALRERLLAATGEDSVEALLHRFTARDQPMGTVVGAVVRVLFETARDDAVAREIVVAHGTGIGEVATAAARRVGIERESYALSFCGGLARPAAEPLIGAAVDAVRTAGQSPRRVEPRWQPAVGALSIALRVGSDGERWPRIADRLDATSPPKMLYDVLSDASR